MQSIRKHNLHMTRNEEAAQAADELLVCHTNGAPKARRERVGGAEGAVASSEVLGRSPSVILKEKRRKKKKKSNEEPKATELRSD